MKNDVWYFTDEDYDAFSFENESSTDKPVRDAREGVRLKLLDLNKPLLKRLLKAGIKLYNHPASIRNPKLITSLTTPCEFNKGKVSWLGIRYGKSEQHLNLLNYGIEPRWKSGRDNEIDKLGFQKYACLQVDVDYSGVDVGIYHAVPHDALDRAYLHDNIDKKSSEIINALSKIRFKGYEWSIYDPDTDTVEIFYFDKRPLEDFIKWYKTNDKDGTYSFMLKHFPRYDFRISRDYIEDTCFDVINELYELYHIISWQPNIVKGVTD